MGGRWCMTEKSPTNDPGVHYAGRGINPSEIQFVALLVDAILVAITLVGKVLGARREVPHSERWPCALAPCQELGENGSGNGFGAVVRATAGKLRVIWKMKSEVNCFEMWWPGTELNRRRQPFQNSSFQCFQQLQWLSWDCQTLESTRETREPVGDRRGCF